MRTYIPFLGLILAATACGSSSGPDDAGGDTQDDSNDQGDSDSNGAGDTDPGDGTPGDSAPTDTDHILTDAERATAATATAETNSLCTAIAPFYWELGDVNGIKVSGARGDDYARDTLMSIASASKWLYGAYVVEKRAGVLTAEDIKFLNFQSGYTSFTGCTSGSTVDECLAAGANGTHHDDTDGFFRYGGGHMQKHASLMGLGAMKNAALAAELRDLLGEDIEFVYSQPQPAGGVVSNAENYALFLHKLLAGDLYMTPLLGTHRVCTNPLTCPQALGTPVPDDESWSYSIGHWVEDDPEVGDDSVSSAGAFGFYPWIDSTRTLYGIIARNGGTGSGFESMYCGRLIRKAWVTGLAQ